MNKRGCNPSHGGVTLLGCNPYLCGMEKADMIKRYTDGESVTSIAKEAGVTRQAIIKHLKSVGVHRAQEDAEVPQAKPKSLKTDKKPTVVSQKALQLISGYDLEGAKGEVYFGSNVYYRKGEGFYWKRWVGYDKPLINVGLAELTDTFVMPPPSG